MSSFLTVVAFFGIILFVVECEQTYSYSTLDVASDLQTPWIRKAEFTYISSGNQLSDIKSLVSKNCPVTALAKAKGIFFFNPSGNGNEYKDTHEVTTVFAFSSTSPSKIVDSVFMRHYCEDCDISVTSSNQSQTIYQFNGQGHQNSWQISNNSGTIDSPEISFGVFFHNPESYILIDKISVTLKEPVPPSTTTTTPSPFSSSGNRFQLWNNLLLMLSILWKIVRQ